MKQITSTKKKENPAPPHPTTPNNQFKDAPLQKQTAHKNPHNNQNKTNKSLEITTLSSLT
jgi:hypothetical protein